ncbi:topoisomerase [Candidatus Pacearchaeota archaeon ex4484_26]|nr:MAG: topoisomerase [Candidatus Pacearchaeota archaeon ex4484_26]
MKFRKKPKPCKSRELELLKKWISELRHEQNKPIIVEGKKDQEALAKFGIKSEPIHKTNRALNEVVDSLSKKKECILLVDLDKAGRKFNTKMKNDLQHMGVKVNSRYRNFLLAKTRLRFIEGLDTYIKNLQLQIQKQK